MRSEFACLFRGGVTGAHLSPEGNEDIDKQRLTLLWRGWLLGRSQEIHNVTFKHW